MSAIEGEQTRASSAVERKVTASSESRDHLRERAKGLKVLLLNEFFYPDDQGGSGSATSYFARRLSQDYGIQVTTVTSRYAYRDPSVRYPKTDEWLGISIHRVPSPNWGRLKTIKRLFGNLVLAYSVAWRAVRLPRQDVTLVVTNPIVMPIAARLLRSIRGTPYTYLVYDLEPDRIVTLGVKPESSRSVRIFRRWQSGWLHRAANVIAIGRCMRDRLIRQYDLQPERVVVAEIGADPKAIVPQPKQSDFRAKNDISGFVVLYSGNFGRYHDFDTILDAAEKLQSTDPDVRFVLVGRGFKREYILEQIESRNLPNVAVYPFVPESEFSDLLASADLEMVTLEPGMEGICVPGKFYTFMSSGRPIVALMQPESEVARVVLENRIGYCVQVGDVDELIRIIREGKSSPEMLEEMGQRGRQVFESLYTADHVTEKMVAALLAARESGEAAGR